jgi:hypothetical protein
MKNKYIIEIDSSIGFAIDVERKKIIINYDAYSCDSSFYGEYDAEFCPFSGKKLDDIKNDIDAKIEKVRLKEERLKEKQDKAFKEQYAIYKENFDKERLKRLKKEGILFSVKMNDGSERLVFGNSRANIRLDFDHISKSQSKNYIKIV